MKKSQLLCAVCACAFLFVFTSSKAAYFIGSSDPNVIDFVSVPGFTDIEVRFTTLEPIWIDFDNAGILEDEFHISIFNETGIPWTDFHFEFADAEILQPISITPVTGQLVDIQFTLNEAWLFFDPPETVALLDGIGIIGTPLSQFSLHIAPSTVPIPGAVWFFGSGLLGLIGIARRKKA